MNRKRIISQDKAAYPSKESKYINDRSYPFSSDNLKKSQQEDAAAAFTSPSVIKLEDYEVLFPTFLIQTKRSLAD